MEANNMKFKIVVDSSSNLTNSYIKDEQVGFQVVPLTLRVDGIDYIDDENLDVKQLLTSLHKAKSKPTSSCPAPSLFAESYSEAEYVFCFTISRKLSGCFNSAFVGGMDKKDSKIHVVDSKATSGNLILLVDKTYQLIKQGLSYDEICEQIDEYNKQLNLLFILDSFDMLVKNGRMSKIVAFVASSLSIKPLCIADDGEIKIDKKVRTINAAIKALVSEIANLMVGKDISSKTCIVTCLEGDEIGPKVKQLIEETYNFKEVKLFYHRGLCAFYALEGGVIVSF